MATEMELRMCRAWNHKVKVTLKDGMVFVGPCVIFTQALDNEPEIASMILENPLRNGEPCRGNYIQLEEPEIQDIEYLD